MIGAVYLSAGRLGAETLVHHLFDPVVINADRLGAGLDFKTSLQEVCAQLGYEPPVYEITESGPDHDKRFDAAVRINGTSYPPGHGHNKKQAEQEAAGNAFAALVAIRDAQQSAHDGTADAEGVIPSA